MSTPHTPPSKHDAIAKHDAPAAREAGAYDHLLLNPDRSDAGEEHLTVRDEQVLRSAEEFEAAITKGAERAKGHNPNLNPNLNPDHDHTAKKK